VRGAGGMERVPGRHIFEIKKRIAGEVGYAVLSVIQAGLRAKDVNSGEGQVSQDYSKYRT
jgi:type I restriction enzyme, S subunit